MRDVSWKNLLKYVENKILYDLYLAPQASVHGEARVEYRQARVQYTDFPMFLPRIIDTGNPSKEGRLIVG